MNYSPTSILGIPPTTGGVRIAMAAILLVLGILGFILVPAQAQVACEPGSVQVSFNSVAAPVWEVEGKVTAYDLGSRTITANGMTIKLPDGFLIKTHDLGQTTGNLSLAELVDDTLPSIIGGTLKADGRVEFPASSPGCMSLLPESVFFEMDENGVVGPLVDVFIDEGSPADSSFIVNGTMVKMNQDPRFTADLFGIGGRAIQFSDLVGNQGALVSVDGYFAEGILRATVVEADVVPQDPAGLVDTVIIEQAQLQKDTRLRVRGVVSTLPGTNSFTQLVSVYNGTAGQDGEGKNQCNGILLNDNVPVEVDGTFSYRNNNVAGSPSVVCVISKDGGGIDDAPVTLK
jgi:hypothetical protein